MITIGGPSHAPWARLVDELRIELLVPDELTRQIYARAIEAGIQFEPEPVMGRLRPWLDEKLIHVDRAHLSRVECFLKGPDDGTRPRDIYHATEVARTELDRYGQPSLDDIRDLAGILLASLESR